jgi:hypothetical protein
MGDRQQLDDVLFHETESQATPGHSIRRLSQNRRMNTQRAVHVYEGRPRKDKRGFDLTSKLAMN